MPRIVNMPIWSLLVDRTQIPRELKTQTKTSDPRLRNLLGKKNTIIKHCNKEKIHKI